MRVYVHILVWNDRRYLPELFSSLDCQTYTDRVVRVLDNGSTDESYRYLQEHHPHAVIARNVRNQGFAGGHNQLLRFTFEHMTEDEGADAAILIMNADMIADPGLIAALVAALESDDRIDAVQPKIYRAFGEHVGDESLEETVQSDILDSTGLRVGRGWRMADRGAGEIDKGQYDTLRDIFAVGGACAMIRASAIRDVLVQGELYDGEFFAYREDCDLAWRFRAAGHRSAFIPSAKVWHYRGMYGKERASLWNRLWNRKKQRPYFAALATRNQLFVLLKNLTLIDAVLAAPWVLFHEVGRCVYGLLFEKETRKLLLQAPVLLPSMLRKRKVAKALRRESAAILRKYIT